MSRRRRRTPRAHTRRALPARRAKLSRMSPRAVDQLNVGLMLGSLAAAFALPFELFLFAYAVLGPLHYLTEIAWLGEREFFMRRPGDKWVLGAIAVLVLLGQRGVFGDAHFTTVARITPHLIVVALG